MKGVVPGAIVVLRLPDAVMVIVVMLWAGQYARDRRRFVEKNLHRSRRNRRLLEGRAIRSADSQRGGDPGGGAGHGAGTVVGVACCAGLEYAGEGEMGEGENEEGGEMHGGGCGMEVVVRMYGMLLVKERKKEELMEGRLGTCTWAIGRP